MKRHKSLIPLSQDHHNGLMLAQLIKKGAPEYQGLPTSISGKIDYVLMAWENELKIHFQNEEVILFPFLFGRDEQLDKLIEELRKEHIKISEIVGTLSFSDDQEGQLNNLGILLENHIRKEERELFEKAQILIGNALFELEGKILPAKKSCNN